MKTLFFKVVKLIGGRKIIERKYYSAGIGLMLVNYFYKWFISRHKADFLLHFSSRFNYAEKLIVHPGSDNKTVYISLNASNACYYQGFNGIEIGQGTLWAAGCSFITANHSFKNLKENQKGGPIKIGDYVWIGAHCVILPEVIIGDYCIVGAGSVVTKSADSHLILAGVPAKPIARRCLSCLDKIPINEKYCEECKKNSSLHSNLG